MLIKKKNMYSFVQNKSNIAMLIFGVEKINRFYFFERKKGIFHALKPKLVQKIKKSTILVRFFSFTR